MHLPHMRYRSEFVRFRYEHNYGDPHEKSRLLRLLEVVGTDRDRSATYVFL